MVNLSTAQLSPLATTKPDITVKSKTDAKITAMALPGEPINFPDNQAYVKIDFKNLAAVSNAWLIAQKAQGINLNVKDAEKFVADIFMQITTDPKNRNAFNHAKEVGKDIAINICEAKQHPNLSPRYLGVGTVLLHVNNVPYYVESIGLVYDCSQLGPNRVVPFKRPRR